MGLFGYDLVRYAEPTVGEPNPDELGVPDLALMVSDVLLAFDHFTHTVTVLANVFADGGDLDARYAEAVAAIVDVRERLSEPVPRAAAGVREPPEYESNMGADGFAQAVERVKEYIRAGDAYQVVPSQRWSADAPVEAFSVYRGLRAINPSPYMYFLDFEDFQIAGASPEALVTVTGRRAAQRPIAGTRPRAGTMEEDLRRADDLLADEKERAEHVMLVDLGRNDLGRVCEYGSVTVDELMVVETYSHVMHIVSSVSGTLRDGVTAMDALRASLPAGTLSGAPKIRAMQIIDELESVKRGPYGGASATCPTAATSTPASTSAPPSSRTAACTCRRAAASWPTRTPRTRCARPRRRRAPCGRPWRWRARSRTGRDVRVLIVDNYDSFTYNLVQYLGELGAELDVVRNDVASVDELLERGADRAVVSPGPVHAGRGGRVGGGDPALGRRRRAGAGRLPRPPGDGAGVRRPGGARRAGARQDRVRRARRQDDLQRPRIPARGRPLPLARRGPRPAGRARGARPARARP